MKEKGKKKLVILYSIIIILIIAIIIMLSVILKTYKIKNESISSKNEVIKLFVNKYVEEKYLNHDLLKIFIIYDNEEHKNSNEIKMQYVLAYTINQNKKTNVQMEEIKRPIPTEELRIVTIFSLLQTSVNIFGRHSIPTSLQPCKSTFPLRPFAVSPQILIATSIDPNPTSRFQPRRF